MPYSMIVLPYINLSPFLDNKMPIFEGYGAFNGNTNEKVIKIVCLMLSVGVGVLQPCQHCQGHVESVS